MWKGGTNCFGLSQISCEQVSCALHHPCLPSLLECFSFDLQCSTFFILYAVYVPLCQLSVPSKPQLSLSIGHIFMKQCLSSAEQLLQIKDTDHLLYFNGPDLILVVINDKFTSMKMKIRAKVLWWVFFFPHLC